MSNEYHPPSYAESVANIEKAVRRQLEFAQAQPAGSPRHRAYLSTATSIVARWVHYRGPSTEDEQRIRELIEAEQRRS